jgi:hypothetical protein
MHLPQVLRVLWAGPAEGPRPSRVLWPEGNLFFFPDTFEERGELGARAGIVGRSGRC